MDLSKLPRLSETDKQTPPPQAQSDPAPALRPLTYEYAQPPALASAADAWINIAIGAILLLMNPRMLQWIGSRIFGSQFNEFMKPDGTVVPYPQVPEFWSDLGPTLFAIVLIAQGIMTAALPRRRPILLAIFGLTVIATAFNFIYLITSYSTHGLAMVSALAVVFGVYMAIQQWSVLQATRPAQ